MKIKVPSTDILEALHNKVNFKTKPLGALGDLEKLAIKVGTIQQTTSPRLCQPRIVVFAGDHGIAMDGVSAYPQEVTFQMVLNFLSGGAAINVFAKQHKIDLTIVDAGVNHNFQGIDELIDLKIAFGTDSFLNGPAMSRLKCDEAISKGAALVDELYNTGTNVIGFGEMGIGNTASASMIMHNLTGIRLEDCIGRGTGVNDTQYQVKIEILKRALIQNGTSTDPMTVLRVYGGFEIAMMCGAMLAAAEKKMTLLVDGFIASAAYLLASKIDANIEHYSIFCHQSEEKGHQQMLSYLNAEPILHLNMRLGEGTGCAMAFPIIEAAVNFLNEMASFESAGVSEKDQL